MAQFFQVNLVNATAAGWVAYQVLPDVAYPFPVTTFRFSNEAAAERLVVSFDGVNDHVSLTPTNLTQFLTFRVEQAVGSIWVRHVTAGAIVDANLRVMAQGST